MLENMTEKRCDSTLADDCHGLSRFLTKKE